MNQHAAMDDTMILARQRGMPLLPGETIGLEHLSAMYMTVRMAEASNNAFSDAKLGRWLGWMQACIVAAGCATLEEMKEINWRHAD